MGKQEGEERRMIEPQIEVPYLKGWRGEVGMLVPVPGMLREYEAAAPQGIKFEKTILGLEAATPEALTEMANQIEIEARKLNMAYKCDVICLACTSGSFIGGAGYDQEIIERIERASGSLATTTTTCVVELLADMGINKIVLVGPYTDPIFDAEVKFFEANGIEAIYVKGSGLGLVTLEEFRAFIMDPYSGYKLVRDGAKADPSADCIFFTCMASPLLGLADILEQEIGKPVISSLSATLYGILKKLGISDPVNNYGEGLRRPRLPHQKTE